MKETRKMLKRAREVIASGDERLVVDFAIEANRTMSRASVELEEAKGFLRQAAARDRAGAPSVELEGNLGVVTVHFPPSEPKTRKGRDLKDVEVNLPPEVFTKLFSKEVVIRPVDEFESLLEGLSPTDRAIVERFVEIKPSTPKVHITK